MGEEIGYYDDICDACGREHTVSIRNEEQTKWLCYTCEFENDVREEA